MHLLAQKDLNFGKKNRANARFFIVGKYVYIFPLNSGLSTLDLNLPLSRLATYQVAFLSFHIGEYAL